jgi:WD40 repeat protein
MGNRELEDRQPLRSSVYYAASLNPPEPKKLDDKKSQSESNLARTALFVKPLVDRLINASISPNGKHMIAIAENETVLVDPESGKTVKTIVGDSLPANSWSPDSRHVATFTQGSIKLWDAETGTLIADLPEAGGSNLYWSDNGKRLVSAGNSMFLWNAETGKLIKKLLDSTFSYSLLTWAADDTRFASIDTKGQLQLWDTKDGALVRAIDVKFSVDPTVLLYSFVIGSKDRLVTSGPQGLALWNAHDGSLRKTISETNSITQLVVSDDGETIIALDKSKIRLWAGQNGSLIAELPGDFIAFSTMGTGASLRLISTDMKGNRELWNARTGTSIKKLPETSSDKVGENPFANKFLILGNRDRFATSDDEGVTLWNSITGEPMHEDKLPVTLSDQTKLRWSDDDRRLLIQTHYAADTDEDGSAQLWDAETGKPIAFVPLLEGFNNLAQLSWPSQRLITSDFRFSQLWKLPVTAPPLSELMQNVSNSGCELVDEKIKCKSDDPPWSPRN